MGDNNLNTHDSSNYDDRAYLRHMRDDWYEYLDNKEMAILNNEFTRFSSCSDNSCIDHFTSNSPNNLFNVTTIPIIFSDHAGLS